MNLIKSLIQLANITKNFDPAICDSNPKLAQLVDKHSQEYAQEYNHLIQKILDTFHPKTIVHPAFERNPIKDKLFFNYCALRLIDAKKIPPLPVQNFSTIAALVNLKPFNFIAKLKFAADCILFATFGLMQIALRSAMLVTLKRKLDPAKFLNTDIDTLIESFATPLALERKPYKDAYFSALLNSSQFSPQKTILLLYVPPRLVSMASLENIRASYPNACIVEQVCKLRDLLALSLQYAHISLRVLNLATSAESSFTFLERRYLRYLGMLMLRLTPNPFLCAEAHLRHFKKKGIKLRRIINSYENNDYEKNLILAARKHYPEAKTIGIQHAGFALEAPCYWPSPYEISQGLVPDEIYANGPTYLQILQEKTPELKERIKLGPSARYPKPLSQETIGRAMQTETLKVLLICNIELKQAAAGARFILEALEGKNAHFRFRLHPTMQKEEFLSQLQKANSTTTYAVDTYASIEDSISNADLVLTQSLGSSLDLCRFGLKTFLLAPNNNLSLTVFLDKKMHEMRKIIYTESDLLEIFTSIKNGKESQFDPKLLQIYANFHQENNQNFWQ